MNTEFKRNVSVRKAIRFRSNLNKLSPYAPKIVKDIQKQRIYNQVVDIPLDQVYAAIEVSPMEELDTSFYIDEEDAKLVALHRKSSARGSLKVRRGQEVQTKIMKTSGKKVSLKPKNLKVKMTKALSAIDRFFTKA